MLSEEEKTRLLHVARLTVETFVREGRKPDVEVTEGALREVRGAFVTLHKGGMLRGCIGVFNPDTPLWETVVDMAVAAATRDTRFSVVTAAELGEIDIEISALTPLKKTDDPTSIEVGRHGIYIIKGPMRGVLLPQVATDHGWDRETFLRETCHKAGLAGDAWKEGAEINTFEAEVFGEKDGG